MTLSNAWAAIGALRRLACPAEGPAPSTALRSAPTAMPFALQAGPGLPAAVSGRLAAFCDRKLSARAFGGRLVINELLIY